MPSALVAQARNTSIVMVLQAELLRRQMPVSTYLRVDIESCLQWCFEALTLFGVADGAA